MSRERIASSQWEFGELFPPQAMRPVLSVTELTLRIKGVLEREVGGIWVGGEVSNVRVQSSGHAYFTLKDPNAQLCCVLFRGVPGTDRSLLRDGQRVVLQGEISVYEPRGQYQLIVRAVEVQGVGALQARFEKLKAQLASEGLFDPRRKRPIARFPVRVGLVTSPTGAALKDVLHVLERRYAGLELVLMPCRVQGHGAATEIARALRALNAWSMSPVGQQLDVIVVTRGGGSLEDLWAFNEEVVARAMAASQVPVVSAVGHEIDFTIADFVADLRAATPSAAAELLTAGYVEARDVVQRQAQRLRRFGEAMLGRNTDHVARLLRRLLRAHPRRKLDARMQRLDEAEAALRCAVREALRRRLEQWEGLCVKVKGALPARRLARERRRLAVAMARLLGARIRDSGQRRRELEDWGVRLRLLSPEHVLGRGYSITMDAATGRVLRQRHQVREGQRLRTRLQSAEVTSVATRNDPVEDKTGRRTEPE
jgi:exodeoxyribonuclease VII large subunit